MGEEYHGDGSAGLRVCHVIGQLIVIGKGLTLRVSAHTSGDVHLLLDHIVPQCPAGPVQSLIPVRARQVRHGRIHIQGTHRMAHGLFLLINGLMGLVVAYVKSLRAVLSPVLPAAL